MQPDARFVEHVGDIHQAAAEMLYHFDTLRFAAGQGVGFTVERQVFQTDICQVLEPLRQRFDHWCRGRILNLLQRFDQLADFHRRHFGNVAPVDPAAERRLTEPGAAADRAFDVGQEGLDHFLRPLRRRFHIAFDVLVGKLSDKSSETFFRLFSLAPRISMNS